MQIDRRRGELAVTVFLLAVAVFFLWGAWRMPVGSVAMPGPAVVPLIASGLLVLTTLVLIVQALVRRRAEAAAPVEMNVVPLAIVCSALVGVALAFEDAGFIVTASVFLLIMLRAFSRLSTLRAAIAAIVIALVANWFFVTLLGVALPSW